jgi:RNA polymerase sigma factor (sigma-70 family)
VRDASQLPDEALLEGYAVGDPAIGGRFVERFSPRVYGLALLITRDERDAEEVAQDAFVRAWRYAPSFDARRGTVASWLLGITRNVAMDRSRVRARRPETPVAEIALDFLADRARTDVVDPEEAAERGDRLGWVVDRLREIPAPQRDVLVAASLYGMTTREIADAFDLPMGTVKTRIRSALRQLRGRVAESVSWDP